MSKQDKRERARLFRERLGLALTDSGQTQSALARAVGVDRSTISQILMGGGTRLPNAQVAAECARALGVSADWLLGLSDRPEQVEDLLALATNMPKAPRALIDEQIFAWHREAAGYKIRHVPAGLPDMLKIHDVLRWEYEPSLGRTTDQAIGASEDRLNWMRSAKSDYEIALPSHDLTAFARAEGYYSGLCPDIRRRQLDWIDELYTQIYPSLRVYLFDARRIYSAPLTIFGPLLSVIYLGSNYITFRDSDRIDGITRHFNRLVREATRDAREFPDVLQELRAQIE